MTLKQFKKVIRSVSSGSKRVWIGPVVCLEPQDWGHPELWGPGLPQQSLGIRCLPQWVPMAEKEAKDRSWAFRSHGVCLARVWTYWGDLLPLSSHPCLPFEMGMSILCPSYHCILEARNLFEKKFCRMNYTLSLTFLSLRWYVDKMLDFAGMS